MNHLCPGTRWLPRPGLLEEIQGSGARVSAGSCSALAPALGHQQAPERGPPDPGTRWLPRPGQEGFRVQGSGARGEGQAAAQLQPPRSSVSVCPSTAPDALTDGPLNRPVLPAALLPCCVCFFGAHGFKGQPIHLLHRRPTNVRPLTVTALLSGARDAGQAAHCGGLRASADQAPSALTGSRLAQIARSLTHSPTHPTFSTLNPQPTTPSLPVDKA